MMKVPKRLLLIELAQFAFCTCVCSTRCVLLDMMVCFLIIPFVLGIIIMIEYDVRRTVSQLQTINECTCWPLVNDADAKLCMCVYSSSMCITMG